MIHNISMYEGQFLDKPEKEWQACGWSAGYCKKQVSQVTETQNSLR